MEGNRFDDLARRFAADSSRRSLLKKSVATIVALAGLERAAGADAARRPSRTPVPPSCPGQQTPCGTECCCPEEHVRCGADCCPAGAQCCDGACCDGTCYGGGLCCPADRLVCAGQCVDGCCSSADCPPGWACGVETPYQCSCVPLVTCASSGQRCGPLTDDCGNVLDCGDCEEPETCGGGGTAGTCGCMVTTTCDGRCGAVTTNCGTALDCGLCAEPCGGDGDCGLCEVCSSGACAPAADGLVCVHGCSSGYCEAGQCNLGKAIECPPGPVPYIPCNAYQCVPTDLGAICVLMPFDEGGSCPHDDPCQVGICQEGVCVGAPRDCGVCGECRDGACVMLKGDLCGGGKVPG